MKHEELIASLERQIKTLDDTILRQNTDLASLRANERLAIMARDEVERFRLEELITYTESIRVYQENQDATERVVTGLVSKLEDILDTRISIWPTLSDMQKINRDFIPYSLRVRQKLDGTNP